MLRSINPYSEVIFAEYSADTDDEVNLKLQASFEAFGEWKQTSWVR